MNKAKLLTSVGSAVMIMAGTAMAGAPTGYNSGASGNTSAGVYDAWSATLVTGATSIVINVGAGATCPAGWTCGAPVTGDGFYQREISNGAAKYFQTIITDAGVSGAPSTLGYADETFVRIGVTGLAGKQRMTVSSVDGATFEKTTFATSTLIDSGWADAVANQDHIDISQGVTIDRCQVTAPATKDSTCSAGAYVTSFDNQFAFGQDTNATTSAVLGQAITMSQMVETKDGNNATASVRTDDDLQKFILRKYTGTQSTVTRTAGSATNLTSNFTNPGNTLLPTGAKNTATGAALNDLAWSAGDTVQVSWIGQSQPSTNEVFSYQGYEKTVGGTTTGISYFDTTTSAPFTWMTSPFGTQPTIP
jgi:hypothetical protein